MHNFHNKKINQTSLLINFCLEWLQCTVAVIPGWGEDGRSPYSDEHECC